MTNETLKPCPFCGSEAELYNHKDGSQEIFCKAGDCIKMPSVWNTRPLEKQARIQAIQECLDTYSRCGESPMLYVLSLHELINKEKGE